MLKQIIIILSILLSNNVSYSKDLNMSFKFKKLENMNLADDVAFFDSSGKKHFLEEYEGKTVLLAFWATWCSPCVNEMSHLDTLQKDFRKLDFIILPISEDYTGIEAVKQFYSNYRLRHLSLLHDYKNALFNALGIAGLPTSILIDKDGNAVGMFTGNVSWYDDEVRNILLSYIPGNPVAPKNSYKDKSLNHMVGAEKLEPEKHGPPMAPMQQENIDNNPKENVNGN